MATITLTFSNDPQQTGITVGDTVYYIDTTSVASLGGFNTTSDLDNIIQIGTVLGFSQIGGNYIVNVTNSLAINLPTQNDYIFFSKNNSVELSSIKGYFASLKFVNDSTDYAELFQVGVGVTESSK